MTISPLIFIVVCSIVGPEYHYMARSVRFTFKYYPYIAAFTIGLAKFDSRKIRLLPTG
jgi:hypothetical protein